MERLSPYAVGTTLYVPSTAWKYMENILAGKYGVLPSVTLCLEDSIDSSEVAQGMECIGRFLAAARQRDGLPHIFIRPRDGGNLSALLDRGGLEGIAGFVLPKFRLADLPDWERRLQGMSYLWMPTLETADAFDPAAMRELADALLAGPGRERIVALRIGGNDLQQQIGVRRSGRHTVYEGPLGYVLGMLATIFLPRGFALTAPVFELLDDEALLAAELERDILHGFCGKTAIHPSQLGHIQAAFRVTPEEAASARAILEKEKAVFRFDGRMCEPATHSHWARKILERREVFGESGPQAEPDGGSAAGLP